MQIIAKAALVALGAVAFASAAHAQPKPAPWNPSPSITASLDIGGSGNFSGVLDNGQLCYIINAAGLANPTAAVIRSGKKSDNGAVVMNLRAPVGGSVGDCRTRKRTGESAGLTLRKLGGAGSSCGRRRSVAEICDCTSRAAPSMSDRARDARARLSRAAKGTRAPSRAARRRRTRTLLPTRAALAIARRRPTSAFRADGR